MEVVRYIIVTSFVAYDCQQYQRSEAGEVYVVWTWTLWGSVLLEGCPHPGVPSVVDGRVRNADVGVPEKEGDWNIRVREKVLQVQRCPSERAILVATSAAKVGGFFQGQGEG